MNRSFFGLLRASLLRPSTPFFGTCFVWQHRGAPRHRWASTRSTASARPAGAVTASHWRCDCDRSLCAPESRLWAVCREERPKAAAARAAVARVVAAAAGGADGKLIGQGGGVKGGYRTAKKRGSFGERRRDGLCAEKLCSHPPIVRD